MSLKCCLHANMPLWVDIVGCSKDLANRFGNLLYILNRPTSRNQIAHMVVQVRPYDFLKKGMKREFFLVTKHLPPVGERKQGFDATRTIGNETYRARRSNRSHSRIANFGTQIRKDAQIIIREYSANAGESGGFRSSL